MSLRDLVLGPFVLESPLGRGAMGEVWRGRHEAQQVPVAVKILHARFARELRYRAAFRREVRAVAGLNHPGVVHVLDCGEITARAAQRAGDPTLFNRPYLVMELASGGSIDRLDRPMRWPQMRAVALSLLDALAHAHARGVIHRDIKPANVLLALDGDARPKLKLTDFGIAHATSQRRMAGHAALGDSAGTPQYMAPEQFVGRLRDHGPWTDLYALGCLLFELLTGAPPFGAREMAALARSHIDAPVPPIDVTQAVPEGLDAWMGRLLAKEPSRRFQRAADAAFALSRLEDPAFVEEPLATRRRGEAFDTQVGVSESWLVEMERALQGAPLTLDREAAPTLSSTIAPMTAAEAQGIAPPEDSAVIWTRWPTFLADVPPLPETWRRQDDATGRGRLVGAGLGLYGLRAVPFVDREIERDAIWEALGEVGGGGAGMVIVSGQAGVGKSRLVEWMCERAHEVGAATIMVALHGPTPGPGDGLPRMLLHHLRCEGVPVAEVLEHVVEASRAVGIVDPSVWRALAAFVAPDADAQADPGQAARSPQRGPGWWRGPLRRLIEGEARRRPVMIWLDDVHWGVESLELAEALLVEGAEVPVLLALTARAEAVRAGSPLGARFERLAAHPRCRWIELAPLSRGASGALVEELLGLEGALVEQIAERSEGIPLFAVQLVGDWVQRGVLEVGPRGFVLAEGESAKVSDDIHQLWMARLSGLSRGAIEALEIAAVLGQEVTADEWAAACKEGRPDHGPEGADDHDAHDRGDAALGATRVGGAPLGEPARREALAALLERRLATGEGEAWRFTHGMMRESLERSAAQGGRLSGHRARCVEALRPLQGRRRGVSERLGGLFEALGRDDEALGGLLAATLEAIRAVEYARVDGLLDRCRALVVRLAGQAGPRRAEVLRAEGLLRRLQGRLDEATALARRAAALALAEGWEQEWALAVLLQAQVRFERWAPEGMVDLLKDPLEILERCGDEPGAVDALIILAHIHMRQGDLEQAEALYERACALSRAARDDFRLAECVHGLGFVARQRGDLERAEALHREALEGFECFGNLLGAASCVNNLAEVLRFRGQLDQAETGYRRALHLQEMIGSGAAIYPRLNLGLILTLRERYAEARLVFEACREQAAREGRTGLLVGVEANLLPCLAVEGRWAEWDAQAPGILERLEALGLVDPDLAWPIQRAAELAERAGHAARARPLYVCAAAQWRALGQQGEALEIERRLSAGEGFAQ